jgi:HAD superfamily hydrolase (TIGR01509 family)
MIIKGLLFDFDGLILDTEGPEYEAWNYIFNKYDVPLPLDVIQKSIGVPNQDYDLVNYLQDQLDYPIDHATLHKMQHDWVLSRVSEMHAMPGIKNILDESIQHGMRNAVASSSSRAWVTGHVTRLCLSDYFLTICTREDVVSAKPSPDLYLLACQQLGIKPAEAIVFEDSPNGITAAIRAGCHCICIPNQVTALLDNSHADLILDSLPSITLNELISYFSEN